MNQRRFRRTARAVKLGFKVDNDCFTLLAALFPIGCRFHITKRNVAVRSFLDNTIFSSCFFNRREREEIRDILYNKIFKNVDYLFLLLPPYRSANLVVGRFRLFHSFGRKRRTMLLRSCNIRNENEFDVRSGRRRIFGYWCESKFLILSFFGPIDSGKGFFDSFWKCAWKFRFLCRFSVPITRKCTKANANHRANIRLALIWTAFTRIASATKCPRWLPKSSCSRWKSLPRRPPLVRIPLEVLMVSDLSVFGDGLGRAILGEVLYQACMIRIWEGGVPFLCNA